MPEALRRTRWVCLFTGVWGVLTGYAVFILFSQQVETTNTSHAAWQLFAVLAVAVAVVAIIEWLRELINGGEKVSRRRTLASVLISLLLLGVFELCVLAYEEVSRSGLEDSNVLLDVALRVTSLQRHTYGFISTIFPDDANSILFDLLEAAKYPNHDPRTRIVGLLPDLQRILADAHFQEPPAGLSGKGFRDFKREMTEPIWRAWIPWARPMADARFPNRPKPSPDSSPNKGDETPALVEGTEESLRSHSLVLTLNKILADVNFYREEDFQYPEFFQTDVGLRRVQDELLKQQRLRRELTDLETEIKLKGGIEPVLEWRRQNVLARMLPLHQIVQRNRDLLESTFAEVFRPISPPQAVPGWRELATLAVVWLLGGGVLGWSLGLSIFRASAESAPRSALHEAARGAITSLVAAPAAVILYTVVTQFGFRAEMLLNDLRAWGFALVRGGPPEFLYGHPRAAFYYTQAQFIQTEVVLAWMFRHVTLTGGIAWLCIFALLFLWRRESIWRPMAWTIAGVVWIGLEVLDQQAFRLGATTPTLFRIGVVVLFVLLGCIVFLQRKYGFEYPTDLVGWGLIALFALPWLVPRMQLVELPLIFVPLLFTVAISLFRTRNVRIPVIAVWVLNGLFFLFQEFSGGLWRLSVLVGMVWLIPGAFLGASVPYLRLGSSLPKVWGVLGLSVGAGLLALTWLRFQELWWMSIPAALLIVTGVLIHAGWSVEEFWPLAGLVLGILISGGTFILQEASFGGVLEAFYAAELGHVTLREELRLQYAQDVPPRPDQIQLAQFGEELEAVVAEEGTQLKEAKRFVTQRLELSIVGSLGFWITIGVLAGWSIFRDQRLVVRTPKGPPRCFWATKDLLEYHDGEHGLLPSNDAQLFRRFSLELLVNEIYRAQQRVFEEVFHGFDPARVAMMTMEEVREFSARRAMPSERRMLAQEVGISMVIENARRFVTFGNSKPGPETQASVLKDWESRRCQRVGSGDSAAGLIAHIRKEFLVPRAMPLRTVLQGLGLIPGAHFVGCFRYKQR